MSIVYRKFQNGIEFMKIVDGTEALSVLFSLRQPDDRKEKSRFCRLHYTRNLITIQDYLDDHVSMPSSAEEFTKAWDQVSDHLSDLLLKQE